MGQGGRNGASIHGRTRLHLPHPAPGLQLSREEGKREYGKSRVVSKREMGKEGISSEGKRMSWGIGDEPASGLVESQRSREPLEWGPKQHQ